MLPKTVRNIASALIAVVGFSIVGSGAPVTSRAVASDLKTFKYIASSAPLPTLPAGIPLQFNGSVPGQGDTQEQLGWWPVPSPSVTTNTPVDLVSFVQYNANKGIVFWAERTAFEVYLAPVTADSESYAAILGQPSTKPGSLAGSFTIDEIPSSEQKYGFGWNGDYQNWFVCGGKRGDGEYYGLYYGIPLDGCSPNFVLEAVYQ